MSHANQFRITSAGYGPSASLNRRLFRVFKPALTGRGAATADADLFPSGDNVHPRSAQYSRAPKNQFPISTIGVSR
jgi:hypothetical protein